MKKPVYSVSRSERYHGNLTSYRFVINHKNATFNSGEEISSFFKRNSGLLLKKVYASPLAKKWRSIQRVTAAVKGDARIDFDKGGHDFPLWRATTDYIREPLTTKQAFTKQFTDTRADLERQVYELFTEAKNAYYEESSSQATSITIKESLLYVEIEPFKKHAVSPTRKKKRGRKNRNIRHRNKRVDKSKKVSNVRRKKSKTVRRRRKFSK